MKELLKVFFKLFQLFYKNVNIDFYPEEGELVNELANTIYFEPFTLYGDSADFIG